MGRSRPLRRLDRVGSDPSEEPGAILLEGSVTGPNLRAHAEVYLCGRVGGDFLRWERLPSGPTLE